MLEEENHKRLFTLWRTQRSRSEPAVPEDRLSLSAEVTGLLFSTFSTAPWNKFLSENKIDSCKEGKRKDREAARKRKEHGCVFGFTTILYTIPLRFNTKNCHFVFTADLIADLLPGPMVHILIYSSTIRLKVPGWGYYTRQCLSILNNCAIFVK